MEVKKVYGQGRKGDYFRRVIIRGKGKNLGECESTLLIGKR